MSLPEHPARHFVDMLHRLAPVDRAGNLRMEALDRAALATLRRGLGKPPGTVYEMYPYVIPYAPLHQQENYFLVAALFAMHPQRWPRVEEWNRNFGVSWRHLVDLDPNGRESREQRFVALLKTSHDGIDSQLRHAVSLLKAKEVPVDWEQLLRDLPQWEHDQQHIQRAWSRSFWATAPATVSPQ